MNLKHYGGMTIPCNRHLWFSKMTFRSIKMKYMKSHDMPVSLNPIISIIRGIKSIYQKFNGNDIIIILYHAIPKIPSSDPIISYPLIPSKLIQKCGGRARRGTGGHMKYQYLNVVTVLYIYIHIYVSIYIYPYIYPMKLLPRFLISWYLKLHFRHKSLVFAGKIRHQASLNPRSVRVQWSSRRRFGVAGAAAGKSAAFCSTAAAQGGLWCVSWWGQPMEVYEGLILNKQEYNGDIASGELTVGSWK